MNHDCNGSDWVLFVPLLFGLFVGFVAAGAWLFPASTFMSHLLYDRYPEKRDASRLQLLFGYTREEMGPLSLWSTRIIASLGAISFGTLGASLIASAFRDCGKLHLPIPQSLQISFELRYWPPMLLFIAGALGFAAYYLPKIRPQRQIAFVVFVAAWSFAASEAAAFHVGPTAKTWFALSLAIWLACAISTWRWRAQTR